MEDELLTVSQTANYLQVSDKTVRRLIDESKIEAYKVGERGWRVSESNIVKYLSENTNKKKEKDNDE